MKRFSSVAAVSTECVLSACGGVTAEKLAGTWECDGQSRSIYEFDKNGKYVNDSLPDPNSSYPEGRAAGKVIGTFEVARGSLTFTPTRVLLAVEPRDFPYYIQLASRSDRLRHVSQTTFEIAPGNGHTVMNTKISDKTLTLQVVKRVDGRGQEVRPPSGGWKPMECVKG